jgi:hypothetical protein
MNTYYIYHIKGVKIGCSVNPNGRIKQQGYYECEILETHTNIHTAAVREIALQKEYGYKVDLVKYDAIDYKSNGTKAATTVNKNQGKINSLNGHMKNIQKIGCSLGGKISGISNRDSGKLKEISKLGQLANIKKYGIKIKAIKKDTNEVSIFNSIGLAERALNIHAVSIRNCLKGKQPYSKGYTFQYL